MVWWRLAAVALGVSILAGCSTGGGNAGDLGSGTQPRNDRVVCGLIGQLPQSAAQLQRVDVRDPVAFGQVLAGAVKQYVGLLDQISTQIDPKLQPTVKQVRTLVLEHRFADATVARVPLDTWTADHC